MWLFMTAYAAQCHGTLPPVEDGDSLCDSVAHWNGVFSPFVDYMQLYGFTFVEWLEAHNLPKKWQYYKKVDAQRLSSLSLIDATLLEHGEETILEIGGWIWRYLQLHQIIDSSQIPPDYLSVESMPTVSQSHSGRDTLRGSFPKSKLRSSGKNSKKKRKKETKTQEQITKEKIQSLDKSYKGNPNLALVNQLQWYV